MKKIILGLLVVTGVAFAGQKGTCVETLVNEGGLKNIELCVTNQYDLVEYKVKQINKIMINTIGSLSESQQSLASSSSHKKILNNISSYGTFTISRISIK